jgi:pimeloyl-ACP methyl ester carboxylesterase
MNAKDVPAALAGLESRSVVSRDGTRIHYLRTGTGPGLVVMHGAMQSAVSHLGLARALGDAFTIHLVDRRGRGDSGPYGDGYRVQREVDDLAAVLADTGARDVFGVSAGGLVCLQAATALPELRRAVLFEPALVLAGDDKTSWLPRYDRELAAGQLGAAMVTSMKGFRLGPAILNAIPRGLLAAMTGKAISKEDATPPPVGMTMRRFAPTLGYEGRLVAELTGTLERFRGVGAEVLLLSGSKGLPWIRPGLEALAGVLPRCRRLDLPGLNHGSTGDDSATNRGGRPEVVAAEIRRFLATV